jgi:hypothetical protein
MAGNRSAWTRKGKPLCVVTLQHVCSSVSKRRCMGAEARTIPFGSRERSWGSRERLRFIVHPQYALSCTACTARPEGSTMFFRLASHSSAAAVEQATEGPPGTHSAAQACG